MTEHVEVLGAIHSLQSDFSKKLDDVLEGISGLKGELQHQTSRITEAEERIGKTEDDLNSMHSAIKRLQDKCATLKMKVQNQENRGRRNNLRLIGLPEKVEGQDAGAFLEQWLPRVLGTDTCTTLPVIERAHRIGRLKTSKPIEGRQAHVSAKRERLAKQRLLHHGFATTR
ncbi:LINE-1 retrotransposable element ORF1 protein [Dissostichus eleginoides]|uniref:LINE-1 retrotransposable element ORF1 protein n=1 Tax=Dissostichus eleginoides TaxID=100907 RepID=A0AAD9B411_DISEL|nr:LINE-1 retrotransposable element ORF1 protein [Dissostichus eleginoides]